MNDNNTDDEGPDLLPLPPQMMKPRKKHERTLERDPETGGWMVRHLVPNHHENPILADPDGYNLLMDTTADGGGLCINTNRSRRPYAALSLPKGDTISIIGFFARRRPGSRAAPRNGNHCDVRAANLGLDWGFSRKAADVAAGIMAAHGAGRKARTWIEGDELERAKRKRVENRLAAIIEKNMKAAA